jgi:hypothetical protein
MKHGKAIAWALLCAMMALSLTACGGGGTDGADGDYQKVNLSMAVNGTG